MPHPLCPHYTELHNNWIRSVVDFEHLLNEYTLSGAPGILGFVEEKKDFIALCKEKFLEECAFGEYRGARVSKPERNLLELLESPKYTIDIPPKPSEENKKALVTKIRFASIPGRDPVFKTTDTWRNTLQALSACTHIYLKSLFIDTHVTIPNTIDSISFASCAIEEPLSLPDSITHLEFIFGTTIEKLSILPPYLKALYLVSLSWNNKKIPDITHQKLEILHIASCPFITSLPTLPEGLQELDCSFSPRLQELPTLPESLQVITCNHCENLTTIKNLPKNLKKFDYRRCPNLSPETLTIIANFKKENPQCYIDA